MAEATEAAARKAEDLGISLGEVKGTGADGQIIAPDVERAVEQRRMRNVTDADMQQDSELTAEALRAQPKRTVHLAPADTASGIKLADVWVQVNGHSYQIQRGVDVELPETVYNVLMESRAAVDTKGRALRPELY